MYQHILVGYDGSPVAHKAMDQAAELAALAKAKLSMVSIEENLPHFAADIGEVKDEKTRQNGQFQSMQREARDIAKLRGVDLHRADILAGHVAQAILAHAGSIGADLIVLGNKGASGVWGNLLGTTVDKVSHHAHCAVLIVR